MSWLRHRQPLLLTALLDGLALALGLFSISEARHGVQLNSIQQIIGLIISYWILSWLFGSYSLLRWPKLSWPLMLQRVGLSALATLMLALLTGWLVKTTPLELPLLQRGSLGPLMLFTGIASIAIRVFLHHFQTKRTTRWSALVDATEKDQIKKEWHRCFNRLEPQLFELNCLRSAFEAPGAMLAVSPIIQQSVDLQPLLQEALVRGMRLTSLAQLAEEELQRIPAQWLDQSVLQLGELADGRQLGLSRQLKRFADLLISAVLLICTIPILIPIALAIYLQDRGPVFYSQIRTGLFGEPFKIYKLRTMHQKAETNGPRWSGPNDQRITPMGKWLRQTRLDELPQLLNIIKGEMSLIGPRPERPELEHNLEAEIPNYRLRHLLRPGLSGWAQVNMAYASSVEDAELKLSYDLYYLRNYGPWLDLLILMKTIKTVLKGAGR